MTDTFTRPTNALDAGALPAAGSPEASRAAAGAAGSLRASEIVALLGAVLIGLSVTWVVGHAQADTLHAAAHDTRHATGFPCH